MVDIVGNRTIRSVWDESVKCYANSIFLKFISTEEEVSEYTYSEFDKIVNKAANLFLDFGINKGELVAVHLHNSPEFLISWLALAKIGAVSVPLNIHYTKREADHIINHSNINKVIANDCSVSKYLDTDSNMDVETIFYVNNDSSENYLDDRIVDFNESVQSYSNKLKKINPINSEDNAVILFTSGTTGFPKGAVYTNYNVVFAGIFHTFQVSMRTGDKFLTAMPCYHMDFQQMSTMPMIYVGGTLIVIEHYSASRFWKQIVEHEANFTDIMSTMNRTMMLQPVQEWEKNHNLKGVYFSMGLSDLEKENFENRFNVELLNSYGMTETVTAVTCASLFGDKNWPSVGRPAITYKVKIIDDSGETVGPGVTGEICIWGVPGKTIISEYYNDQEETDKLIDSDGWIHTGDRGYLDEDGHLFFIDRMGNLIKRSGENVSPLEVECVINSHPKVSDCAVIGVPDHIRDEAVKAFITVTDGEDLDIEELSNFCIDKLAYFKVPNYWEIVDDFPRTSTGKIRKNLLR